MKIQNKQFGEIEYSEDSILKFKEGIIGFEELNNFILINEKDSFFSWLTSVDQPEIIFPLFPIELLQEELKKENNFESFGIVKLDKEPEKITINLKAPVFIDQNEKIGFQKISESEELPLDYPLFVNN
ncbi:MAG: flagellar assembly protein FliW [Ignavibacteriae bacterium]|nr:flagellar assembly protein FliW [Ignavibacteriota bacterium]